MEISITSETLADKTCQIVAWKKQSKLTLDYKDRSFYVQNISYERNVLCGKKQIVLRIAVCSYESYSGRVTKWKPDKFSQETGFESMTSVILVKWMLHKTKIHNWSELMIPGLYLKFVIVHQHWAFSLVEWMKKISVLFPRLVLFQRILFEHPLWAPWMGIWAIHLKKTVVRERGWGEGGAGSSSGQKNGSYNGK